MRKIIFFVFCGFYLQSNAVEQENFEQAYKTLVEKYSCSNQNQCGKIEKNLTPEALRKEFEQNEDLIKFKKAIVAKNPTALKTFTYIMEDRLWHQLELSYAVDANLLLSCIISTPIILLAVLGNLATYTKADKPFVGTQLAIGSLAIFSGKEIYDAYKNFQYAHKIKQGSHEIRKSIAQSIDLSSNDTSKK